MVQQAGSRIEFSWERVKARRPFPEGSLKMGGSVKVISRRFSKPSNPIGEGGGGESMAMA